MTPPPPSAPTARAVCVLIPAYNEEKRIGRVVEAVRQQGYPVVVVDDGSTDGTATVARKAGGHCLVSSINEGKGAAIRKGFDWVLKNNFEAVIIMDADDQHDPGQLDCFVEALQSGSADLVVGNRMQQPKGMSLIRRLTNRFMSSIISLVAGQSIPDTQCGYRALTREALKKIVLKTDRFEIESEMLLSVAQNRLQIRSIPVSSMYRDETSHIRPLRDTLRFFKFFFKFIFSNK